MADDAGCQVTRFDRLRCTLYSLALAAILLSACAGPFAAARGTVGGIRDAEVAYHGWVKRIVPALVAETKQKCGEDIECRRASVEPTFKAIEKVDAAESLWHAAERDLAVCIAGGIDGDCLGAALPVGEKFMALLTTLGVIK